MGKYYIGVDIGGTKPAVLLVSKSGKIFNREQFVPEVGKEGWKSTVEKFKSIVAGFLKQKEIDVIGNSCGRPFDSRRRSILSSPKLLGCDDIPITEIFQIEF